MLASLANLPVFYVVASTPDPAERLVPATLLAAFFAIADAWSAGLLIERRRLGLARAFAALTLLEVPLLAAAVALVPGAPPVPRAGVAFAFAALATAAALVALAAPLFRARVLATRAL